MVLTSVSARKKYLRFTAANLWIRLGAYIAGDFFEVDKAGGFEGEQHTKQSCRETVQQCAAHLRHALEYSKYIEQEMLLIQPGVQSKVLQRHQNVFQGLATKQKGLSPVLGDTQNICISCSNSRWW